LERLINAARLGATFEAAALLDAGMDPNGQDAIGASALHRAAQYGRADTVQLLVDHPDVDVAAANFAGQTALHCPPRPAPRGHRLGVAQRGGGGADAAVLGRVDCAAVLVEAGAPLAARSRPDRGPGQTAAELARAHWAKDLAKWRAVVGEWQGAGGRGSAPQPCLQFKAVAALLTAAEVRPPPRRPRPAGIMGCRHYPGAVAARRPAGAGLRTRSRPRRRRRPRAGRGGSMRWRTLARGPT
jgi:hypothetical protein